MSRNATKPTIKPQCEVMYELQHCRFNENTTIKKNLKINVITHSKLDCETQTNTVINILKALRGIPFWVRGTVHNRTINSKISVLEF